MDAAEVVVEEVARYDTRGGGNVLKTCLPRWTGQYCYEASMTSCTVPSEQRTRDQGGTTYFDAKDIVTVLVVSSSEQNGIIRTMEAL